MSDGRTHSDECYKEYGHKDCAVARVEELEADAENLRNTITSMHIRIKELEDANCQKTVEKLGNRIEKRDAKIVKLQRRIKKLEESGADMLAQIDFG